jgi:hypothetical protein
MKSPRTHIYEHIRRLPLFYWVLALMNLGVAVFGAYMLYPIWQRGALPAYTLVYVVGPLIVGIGMIALIWRAFRI